MAEPLVGRYQLIREIGRGGFGLVEEYHDLILGTEVAIKTIAPHFIKQETKRLIREVDIMSFFYGAHPHIIDFSSMFVTRCRGGVDSKVSMPAQSSYRLNVLGAEYQGLSVKEKCSLHHTYLSEDVKEVRRADAFSLHIVMPLMKGDLTSFVKIVASTDEQRRRELTPVYLKTTSAIFAFQLFLGLDYLHRCGIIHRDLKPENILVRLDENIAYNSSVCIADLGLAREAQDSDTFYVCTRYYRAPEVIMTAIKGHPGLDIWSMGCILYEMCTNRTLFTVPSALDNAGAWEGVRASTQLEVIMNVVGTPSVEDVNRFMPSGNAASYLARSATRPSKLLETLRRHWILQCDESEMLEWFDLTSRCLAFFPQQRPTAAEVCTHPLFQRYQIYVGQNIMQMDPHPYHPTFAERDTAHALAEENKARILELVHSIMASTAPVVDDKDDDNAAEEDEEDEEDEDVYDEEGEEERPSGFRDARGGGKGDDEFDANDYMLDEQGDDSDDSDDNGDDDGDEEARNERQEHLSYLNGASSSLQQLRTRDTGDGKAGSSVSSNNNTNNKNNNNGSARGPNVANEEDEDDGLPSALRYASVMNMGALGNDGDDGKGGGSRAGGTRQQSRFIGRRASRGSLFRLNQRRSDSKDAAQGNASGAGKAGGVPRTSSVFYGNNYPQGQQKSRQQEEDLSEAGISASNGAGWYAPSFFNLNATVASSTGPQRPRANSTAAGAGAGASGADGGLAPSRRSSLSADAMHLLNDSKQQQQHQHQHQHQHQQQQQQHQQQQQQQQPRVSGLTTGKSVPASGNASLIVHGKSGGGSTGTNVFVPDPGTDSKPATGMNGSGYGLLDDYGYLLDGGLNLAASASRGRRGSDPTSSLTKGADVGLSTRHRAQEEYPLSNIPNPGFAGSFGREYDASFRNTGHIPPVGESTYARSAVQPLQPVNNNYFSAVNLGTLRAGRGNGGGVTVGAGHPDGAAAMGRRSVDVDPSGDGSMFEVANDQANHFTSSTAYHFSLPDEKVGALSASRGGTTRKGTAAGSSGGGGSKRASKHDDEDEDDLWAVPHFSSMASGSGVGIGSPTQRGPPALSSAVAGGAGETNDFGSPESFLRMMDRVNMGDASDMPLYGTVTVQHNKKANGNGERGANRASGAGTVVGDDPDFPSISDKALRLRYKTVEATDRGAQEAIGSILGELGDNTHDAGRSDQLRSLLTFFTTLQYTIRASEEAVAR